VEVGGGGVTVLEDEVDKRWMSLGRVGADDLVRARSMFRAGVGEDDGRFLLCSFFVLHVKGIRWN